MTISTNAAAPSGRIQPASHNTVDALYALNGTDEGCSPTSQESKPARSQQPDIPATTAAWFWDRVRVGTPDECWPWTGEVGTTEVTGHVRIWLPGVATKQYVHRVAFWLAGGELHPDEVLRHAYCSNASCCNYLHALAGSHLDNARDRDLAGNRTPLLPRGAAHWSAKLTDEDAARIRQARTMGLNAQDLARLYSVSRSTIYAVWSGRHYRIDEDAHAIR